MKYKELAVFKIKSEEILKEILNEAKKGNCIVGYNEEDIAIRLSNETDPQTLIDWPSWRGSQKGFSWWVQRFNDNGTRQREDLEF